jgi:hypothetical protein
VLLDLRDSSASLSATLSLTLKLVQLLFATLVFG